MKKSRVITTIAGVLLFLSIVLTFSWFYPSKNVNQADEIAVADAKTKIAKREIKEANFKQSRVELTDYEGKRLAVNFESDPEREALLKSVVEYNKLNAASPIKYSEEPVSSSFKWLVWFNVATFFIMWAATLAVIVYAVKSLSRNKS